MSNILIFMVMFCFSCSISFADTEKLDADKEKRYQEYKRQLQKREHHDTEYQEFYERSVKEKCGHPDWTLHKCEWQETFDAMIPAEKSAIIEPPKSDKTVATPKDIELTRVKEQMLNDSATRRAIHREMLETHKSLDEIIKERLVKNK